MVFGELAPLRAGVPDWLALSVVVASIVLAIVTLVLMLLRVRPAADEEPGRVQSAIRDPMLLLSVAGVILLAVAAWWLR